MKINESGTSENKLSLFERKEIVGLTLLSSNTTITTVIYGQQDLRSEGYLG
ncbi:MAG: hypothetical protein Q7N50_01210 [Armatimonadota bacterium]|nr:hypothetical protein [Armatimonadota bacterium]